MTRDDPAAFAPPPAFGPFRVLHQIGIGALGPVFRTFEPTRDRLVAVKVFRLDVTPETAQSLADELARAADAGLFHPSIVEPVAAGVEGSVAYRAEEYVAAESLDVAMRHYAPATLDRALPFLTQLAGAIDFARTAGVGHGALHLRDVFVTPDEARASGFGIVEALERVGVRAPVRRPNTAPERIAGAAWSTPADVFSLAAIAYELLTGRRPSGTGDQIGDLSGENLGDRASSIRSVLARAMHDDPARRYATALAFASALESAAHAATTDPARLAAPPLAAEPPRPPAPPAKSGDAPPSPPTPTPAPPPIIAAAPPKPPAPPITAAVPVADVAEAKVHEEDEDVIEDDVAAEREADAAHHLLMRDVDDEATPTLFDEAEEESVADLALDQEAAAAEDSSRWKHDAREASRPAPFGDLRGPREEPVESPAFWSGRHIDDVPPAPPDRSRPAILPMTLMLILGLLLGFAIDRFALGGFERTAPPAQAVVPESKPTPPPAATTGNAQSGRAYSEQTVAPQPAAGAPKSADAPPVPGDLPDAEPASPGRPAAPATSAANESARLTVFSTPTHAAVMVNGRWRGRTPLTLDTLRFGSYSVRLMQPGFTAPSEEVVLSARQPMRTLSIHLQPVNARGAAAPSSSTAGHAPTAPAHQAAASYAGTIYVDSRPRGAKVLIDGKMMGTTPASIPDIPIGSHVVRLELEDHRAWTTSTRVSAGEQSRVTGSLERIR